MEKQKELCSEIEEFLRSGGEPPSEQGDDKGINPHQQMVLDLLGEALRVASENGVTVMATVELDDSVVSQVSRKEDGSCLIEAMCALMELPHEFIHFVIDMANGRPGNLRNSLMSDRPEYGDEETVEKVRRVVEEAHRQLVELDVPFAISTVAKSKATGDGDASQVAINSTFRNGHSIPLGTFVSCLMASFAPRNKEEFVSMLISADLL